MTIKYIYSNICSISLYLFVTFSSLVLGASIAGLPFINDKDISLWSSISISFFLFIAFILYIAKPAKFKLFSAITPAESFIFVTGAYISIASIFLMFPFIYFNKETSLSLLKICIISILFATTPLAGIRMFGVFILSARQYLGHVTVIEQKIDKLYLTIICIFSISLFVMACTSLYKIAEYIL